MKKYKKYEIVERFYQAKDNQEAAIFTQNATELFPQKTVTTVESDFARTAYQHTVLTQKCVEFAYPNAFVITVQQHLPRLIYYK